LLSRAVTHADEIAILRDGRVVASGVATDTDFVDRAERAYFGDASSDLLADAVGQWPRVLRTQGRSECVFLALPCA
jgi:hypothetical protein